MESKAKFRKVRGPEEVKIVELLKGQQAATPMFETYQGAASWVSDQMGVPVSFSSIKRIIDVHDSLDGKKLVARYRGPQEKKPATVEDAVVNEQSGVNAIDCQTLVDSMATMAQSLRVLAEAMTAHIANVERQTTSLLGLTAVIRESNNLYRDHFIEARKQDAGMADVIREEMAVETVDQSVDVSDEKPKELEPVGAVADTRQAYQPMFSRANV